MNNNCSVLSVQESAELKGGKNVLLLTASTFEGWRKKDGVYTFEKESLNEYTFEDIDGKIEGFYQLEPVPKLLARQGNILDLIIVMSSVLARKSEKVQYLNEAFEISPVDFFIKRLKEEDGFNDTKFCIIASEVCTEDGIKDRKEGAISDAVYILRKIRDNSNECKYYLDTHGGIRQDQENLNAITNLLELENIEFDDIFNISGPKEPIKSIKKTRIYDFAAGIKEFVNFGRSKSLDRYLENKDSKIHDIIWEISDALTLCNIEEFEAGLDALNNELGPVPEEYVPAKSHTEIFIETIRNSYKGMLDPKERNLVAELQWAITHGFIQQALALVESKSASFFLKYVVSGNSNSSEGTMPVDQFIKNKRKFPSEDRTNVMFSPVVFQLPRVTEEAIKSHDKLKINEKKIDVDIVYPIKTCFRREYTTIYEAISYWMAIKKIRNHVMHANGMKPSNCAEGVLLRKVTKDSDLLYYAKDSWDAVEIDGKGLEGFESEIDKLNNKIKVLEEKKNKDEKTINTLKETLKNKKRKMDEVLQKLPDISMNQIEYILSKYLNCLTKIIDISSPSLENEKYDSEQKMRSIVIKVISEGKSKKVSYEVIPDILEAQITKFTKKGNTSVKIVNLPEGIAFGGSNKAQNKDGHILGKLSQEPYNKKEGDLIKVKMLENKTNLTTFEIIE